MGAMKQLLLEQAAEEYNERIRDWWEERTGFRPAKITNRMVENFELEEAFAHAMSKND